METFYYVEGDSDLWSDFETSLEKDINYDLLTEIIGENAPNFGSDDFSDGDWITAQVYIEQECDDLLKNIRTGFKEWISSLEISQVKKTYKLDKSDYFITFNYTEVLEKIYRIPMANILHIHNKVGEELIIGHGKNLEDFNVKKVLYGDEKAFLTEDEHGNIDSSEIGHERFAEDAVCKFYGMMRKPTELIIKNHNDFFINLSNVDEIIVLGHSYNQVDFPYFKKLVQTVKDTTKWVLCYYSDDDKQSAERIMKQLDVKTSLQEFKHCSQLEIEENQLKLF